MINVKHGLIVILAGFLSVFFILILNNCGSDNIKPVEDARTQYEQAVKLYNKGKYYQAEIEFQRFIYNYPGNTAVDTAQYYLGMSYYKDKDYGMGAGEFKKLLTSFPASAFTDDAQYRLAMSHYYQSPGYALDQTDTFIAIEEFLNFLDNYPLSDYTDSVSLNLKAMRDKLARKAFSTARLYQKMHQSEPALIYYNKVLNDYTDSPFAAEALYRKGECYIKLGKYELARDALLEFTDNNKDHKYYEKATLILREMEDMPKAEK